jgi:hypothetical protein
VTIQIDGETFEVPIISVDMKGEFLDRYAERGADGVLHREIIGVYFNYSVAFGSTADTAEYARLWNKLTEPVEFHQVTLWDENGAYSLTAYFAGVGHSLRKVKDSGVFWKSLTCNFVAQSPART